MTEVLAQNEQSLSHIEQDEKFKISSQNNFKIPFLILNFLFLILNKMSI